MVHDMNMKLAQFYEQLPEKKVRCFLCRHRCTIAVDNRGICHVRENRGGELYSLVYGRLVAAQVDPIEKKPLFHLLPGSWTYSIATVGCNFHCEHCQNSSIAQVNPAKEGNVPGELVLPEDVVTAALETGCSSIAYTYTEPTVWGEYLLETARLAMAAGLKNIMVTNGYITPEALDELSPYIHASNIDLKGFNDDFYRRVTGARLCEVLDCIRDYYRRGIWIELTTLIIPGENDAEEELAGIANFIAKDLSPDVPWHISRFFPRNRMLDKDVTPGDSLKKAEKIGKQAGLKYVYVGNCSVGNENTECSVCGEKLILRDRFALLENRILAGKCQACGTLVAGVY